MNEKMCRAPELGSYTQGQGHNHVRGQIVLKIVLHINYGSKFDETSQKDKAQDLGSLAQGQGHNQVRGQNRVSAITQKLLKQI